METPRLHPSLKKMGMNTLFTKLNFDMLKFIM